MSRGPRVTPGDRDGLGLVNHALGRLMSRATRVREAHLFTTLGRHRWLYRAWLGWSGALLLAGRIPRRETELVILRVADRCHSEYEWRHHERLGRRAGLTVEEIARVREKGLPGWSAPDAALLAATDQLLRTDDIDDAAWSMLRAHWDERHAIELCLLVGQYRGLAATIRALGVPPDERLGR
ncbi:carboxymuconolactone decarboxylase family protein [Aeromicrobium sp. 179-A 4D2 NHS]|uniref:carboxymuconolactone decarboxylase family protein n=1 Tax=Aeromicrobium sp. 179-A 4D2 NHS TaxID=3142375 RepID=UPI0039A05DC4